MTWQKKAAAGKPTAAEDRSFHRMLYASLGNASLSSLIDIFWVVYHALPAYAVRVDADPQATVQAHRDIFEALRKRDPLLARQRMSSHFGNIQHRISAVAPPNRAQQYIKSGTKSRPKHVATA